MPVGWYDYVGSCNTAVLLIPFLASLVASGVGVTASFVVAIPNNPT